MANKEWNIDAKYEMKPIGYISSPFEDKFGIPRQSGLCPSTVERIYFVAPFSSPEAFDGLEGYSHVWLLWAFSENLRANPSLTVRPPRLGGNERKGVFATRSPFRPNPIGLSCVRLVGIRSDERLGTYLEVSGADLMNGTPILDVKPYIPFTDSHPDAVGGFADKHVNDRVEVRFPEELASKIPTEMLSGLREALEGDPRPAYHSDPERVYGFRYAGFEVKFKVCDGVLAVVDVYKN